ncbi:MAG: acyltransferase family protein, partial [Pseudomonadota bacterium]
MQIFGIHVLRGLAAFAVVVHHASYELAGLGIPTWLPEAEAGAFGVDVFFVISGFVMVYASQGLFGRAAHAGPFLWRRIARVAPLYWLVTTAALSVLLYIWNRDGVPEGALGWV